MNLEQFVHFALENMSHCFYSQHINLRKIIYLYKNWYDLYLSLIPPYVSILCFSYEKIIIIFRVIAFLNVTVFMTEFCLEVGEFGHGLLSNAWMVKHFCLLQTEDILHKDVGKSHSGLERNAIVLTLNIPKGL